MSLHPDWVADDTCDGPARRDIDLSATVVRYTDRPDRCTVYPPGSSGVARMSTWISADADAFLDIETMR
ncbi:DUF7511 domain-containing protein [Haloarcula marina]|uniref:DUF7511 domain-containing protein n=1 Tax=Haloarcula marina TaxID=2961574 RepID=UPI0020B8EA0B|nr:hypothetical protein [Halomicroarcula marina]